MAYRGGSKGGNKGAKGKGAAKRPDPGDRFAKFSLAPYATAEGSPFYVPKQMTEKKLLSCKHIADSRTARNSEVCCLRLGLAVSESAGVAEMGRDVLPYFTAEKIQSTGAPELTTWAATEAGKCYLQSAEALNKMNEAELTEAETRTAIGEWVDGLVDLGRHEKALRKLAQVAARAYLFAADSLEMIGLVEHPEILAAAATSESPTREIKAVKKWLGHPEDMELLKKALLAAYVKQVGGSKRSRKGKRRWSDATSEDATSTSSSSSSSSSAPAKKKKTKKEKKAKEADKKLTARKMQKEKKEETEPATKEKKDQKKEKEPAKKEKKEKVKDKKKSKKAARSSSSQVAKKHKKSKKTKSSSERRSSSTSPPSVKETKPGKSEAAAEARTASFTLWKQSDVQLFVADVGQEESQVGNHPGAVYAKAKLMEYGERIPAPVLAHFPVLQEAMSAVKARVEDKLPAGDAKEVLSLLAGASVEVEAFWQLQTGGADSAATGGKK